MPGQLLYKRVSQANSLQRLPPAAADQHVEMPPTPRPRPASQSTNHLSHLRQLSTAHPRWSQTPHMCHPRLSTACPLCKEMQRPLRPPGKVGVSTAPPTKPPFRNSRWSAYYSDTTTRAKPPSTLTLKELQPQHRKPFPSRRLPQRAPTGRPTRRTGRRLASLPECQLPQRRYSNVRKLRHRRSQHTRHYSYQQRMVNRDRVDGRRRSRFRPSPHHDHNQMRSTGGLGVPTQLCPYRSGKASCGKV